MVTTSTKKYNGLVCPNDGTGLWPVGEPVDGGPHLLLWEVVCPQCKRRYTEFYELSQLVEENNVMRYEVEDA